MQRQMYDKQGNSHLVPNQEVQARLKSGWVFFKPAVVNTEKKSTTKKKQTKRPKATMRITKAEAEVIKKTIKEDN